jgi:polar amino acid transport system substrate-binding protein
VRFAIGEWAPYTSSTYQGVKVAEEVVIRAFATQGYEVKLDYHPWSRSLKLAAQTQYDGSFPWLPNKKRTLKYIYSKPFLRQKIVFFSHKSANFIWSDSTNFDNYVVGGTQDYHATNLLLELGISPIIDSSEESNFNKLAKNRIDLYPAGLSRGKYLINQLLSEEQLETIQVGSKPLIEGDMHIIFSRANTARSNKLKEVFAIGLRQLIDSGEYQAIVSVNNRINEKAPHSVQGFEINNSQ